MKLPNLRELLDQISKFEEEEVAGNMSKQVISTKMCFKVLERL